jgi:hypothetical protein
MASFVIRHLEPDDIHTFRAKCRKVGVAPETLLCDFLTRARFDTTPTAEVIITADLRYVTVPLAHGA